MEKLDIRCPEDPRRLLMKYYREVGKPPVVGNLMELACRECTRSARRTDSKVEVVVHRFDLAGQLVETLVNGVSVT